MYAAIRLSNTNEDVGKIARSFSTSFKPSGQFSPGVEKYQLYVLSGREGYVFSVSNATRGHGINFGLMVLGPTPDKAERLADKFMKKTDIEAIELTHHVRQKFRLLETPPSALVN